MRHFRVDFIILRFFLQCTVSIEYHIRCLLHLLSAEFNKAKEGNNTDDANTKHAIYDAQYQVLDLAADEARMVQKEMNHF
jgi:hypothetical protein